MQMEVQVYSEPTYVGLYAKYPIDSFERVTLGPAVIPADLTPCHISVNIQKSKRWRQQVSDGEPRKLVSIVSPCSMPTARFITSPLRTPMARVPSTTNNRDIPRIAGARAHAAQSSRGHPPVIDVPCLAQ